MTKERLEQLRYIEKTIKAIRDDVRKLNRKMESYESRTLADKAKGSMVEFPYIETHYNIVGVDHSAYDRMAKRLRAKEAELQEELAALEEWLDGIEDRRLQLIFRLKYRNGMTNKQIAEELGYDRSRISQLINDYLRSE